MKRLMSVRYSSGAINLSLLLLRAGMGILLMPHGYDKLINFDKYKVQFLNFMGLGQPASLALTVFGEFFCSILLVLGLFTRLATIPLMIVMLVAVFMAHDGQFFGDGEHAAMYFLSFLVLFITGPGKYSVDGIVNK